MTISEFQNIFKRLDTLLSESFYGNLNTNTVLTICDKHAQEKKSNTWPNVTVLPLAPWTADFTFPVLKSGDFETVWKLTERAQS